MDPLTLVSLSFSVAVASCFIATPYLARYLYDSGIRATDMQKPGKPSLPTSAGIAVYLSFTLSVSAAVALSNLFSVSYIDIPLILAAATSTSIITIVGMIDDIHIDVEEFVRKEMKTDYSELSTSEAGYRVGLSQATKMMSVLPAALPLIAVGAGSWTMSFPVLGVIEWGYVYPLLLLPLGLIFVSNAVNMLAGTNGLSAALASVAAAFVGGFAAVNGRITASVIAFSAFGALVGHLYHGWYPASILPGDSLTYFAGASVFASLVIADVEKFGVMIFIPYILEFCLKARSKFNAKSYGQLESDGSLTSYHDSVYSLTHIPMKLGMNEKQVTAFLTFSYSLYCLCVSLLYYFFV